MAKKTVEKKTEKNIDKKAVKTNKIKVIAKKPGEAPYETSVTNDLKHLQDYVGGYIEAIRFLEDVCLICNEEGKLKQLPTNFLLRGDLIVGNVLFVGVKGEEFADCPVKLKDLHVIMPDLWL